MTSSEPPTGLAYWKKSLGTLGVTVVFAVVGYLSDDMMSPEEWMLLVALIAGTTLVAIVPNFPRGTGGVAEWLKAVCMFAAAAAGIAATFISGGLTAAELFEIVGAGLLALGFTVVPTNRGDFRETGALPR